MTTADICRESDGTYMTIFFAHVLDPNPCVHSLDTNFFGLIKLNYLILIFMSIGP